MAKTSTTGHVDLIVARFARGAVTVVAVVVALGVAGVNAGALVASLGLIGITIGLALRDVLANYVSGILLLVQGPFIVGEYVIVGEVEGTVTDLTARTTNLRAEDGREIFVPNSTVFSTTVINVTRNPVRRFTVTLPVPAEADVDEACERALKALAGVAGVLGDPPPTVTITHVGDSMARVTGYGWVDARDHDVDSVQSSALAAVHEHLRPRPAR
jgi:small-conductance mechanosensitive channel